MSRIVVSIFIVFQTFIVYTQNNNTTIELKTYLKNISNKYNIHFAYPTSLVHNIYINYRNESFKSLDEELKYYLTANDIEFQKMNATHIMLRKIAQKEEEKLLSISCKIVDKNNNQILPFCGVYMSDYSLSTMTDESGFFKLNIPANKSDKNIVVSILGYEEKIIDINSVLNVNEIRLTQAQQELSEVIITYVTPFNDIINKDGSITLDKTITNLNLTSSAKGNDISSTLQLMPGVTANEDNDAGLKIRGGNADETLIVLDEIPLYNATHYYGFFNAVNADYVSKLQLYKNNLPIEYQGGISGLLKMNSSNTIADTSSFLLSANSFMASGIADVKVTDKVGFIIGGRSTYGKINIGNFKNALDNKIDKFQKENTQVNSIVPDYNFYDVNVRLNTKINKRFFTSINFYQSNDDINAFSEFNIKNQYFEEFKKDKLTEYKENTGFSIISNYLLNNSTSLKISYHNSIYNWNKNIESQIQNFSTNPNNNFSNATYISEYLRSSGVKIYLDNNNSKVMNKLGVEYIDYNSENIQEISDRNTFDNKLNGKLLNLFNEYKLNIGNLIVNPAYRLSNFTVNDKSKNFVSPQLSTTFQLNSRSYLKATTSINNQFIREINFEDPFGQQIFITSLTDLNSIPVSQSWNNMIGYNLSNKNFFFDVELWYKNTKGAVSLLPDALPIRKREEINIGEPLPPLEPISYSLITGERKARGIDMMFGFQNTTFTSWIAYTLSKTQDKYQELYEGLWFSSTNDRRHQLKFSNNISVKKFDFTFNYIFTSGRPYLAYEMVDGPMRNDRKNRDQIRFLPEYHRVDIGAVYNFKIFKKEALVGLSVFNLFDRQNLNFLQYNFKIQREPDAGGGTPTVNENLTLGTTYGLVNRLVSFDFKIRL